MRIGVMLGADQHARSVDDMVDVAQRIEAAGLDHVWMANIRSLDAITTMTIVGRETQRIGVGTAVDPDLPKAPGGDGTASFDRRAGNQRPLHPRYWVVPPDRDREYVWLVLRQAGESHARISRRPNAIIA